MRMESRSPVCVVVVLCISFAVTFVCVLRRRLLFSLLVTLTSQSGKKMKLNFKNAVKFLCVGSLILIVYAVYHWKEKTSEDIIDDRSMLIEVHKALPEFLGKYDGGKQPDKRPPQKLNKRPQQRHHNRPPLKPHKRYPQKPNIRDLQKLIQPDNRFPHKVYGPDERVLLKLNNERGRH